jgi:Pyridoxamine 5'-phosphate oxidase
MRNRVQAFVPSGCGRVLGAERGELSARNTPRMTDFPDSHRDLLDGQVATLATIGASGHPQMTEVWFLHDGGELKTSLNSSRLKTRNLAKRPQCSLLLVDVTIEPVNVYAVDMTG